VADGGVAVSLAEMALAGNLGADAQMFGAPTTDAFAEDQGRYVVTTPAGGTNLRELGKQEGVPVFGLGKVVRNYLSIREIDEPVFGDRDPHWKVPLTDLRAAHEGFFPKLMGASKSAS
jgi:phosphoribosylformylglycinamidine synthase